MWSSTTESVPTARQPLPFCCCICLAGGTSGLGSAALSKATLLAHCAPAILVAAAAAAAAPTVFAAVAARRAF
eukprot:1144822-Pelagomonas_calceolata.AAC.2